MKYFGIGVSLNCAIITPLLVLTQIILAPSNFLHPLVRHTTSVLSWGYRHPIGKLTGGNAWILYTRTFYRPLLSSLLRLSITLFSTFSVFSPCKCLLSHPPTLALLHFVTDSLSVACISTAIFHSPVLFQELPTVLVCYTHTHTLSPLSFSFTPVIEMEEWEHLSFANGWWWRIRFLCCNAIETLPPGMRNTGWESNVLDVFAPLWTIIHRHWLLMEQLWI